MPETCYEANKRLKNEKLPFFSIFQNGKLIAQKLIYDFSKNLFLIVWKNR